MEKIKVHALTGDGWEVAMYTHGNNLHSCNHCRNQETAEAWMERLRVHFPKTFRIVLYQNGKERKVVKGTQNY